MSPGSKFTTLIDPTTAVPDAVQIRCLESLGDREIQGLSDVLIDCVEGGASVNFMFPMSRAKADAYWRSAAASVARGDAERLYAREGWQRCGEIPNFALWPDGSPCATVIFFKMLGTQPAAGRDRMQASRAG